MRSPTPRPAAFLLCAPLLLFLADSAVAQVTPTISSFGAPIAEETIQDEPPSEVVGDVQQVPPFTIRLGGRLQIRAITGGLAGTPPRTGLQIRRARAALSGAAYERFEYTLQVELAGSNASLLDANVRTQIIPVVTLWGGQGKAPFGRQQLTSSGNLHFVDRSIVDARFAAGRQIGAAVTGRLAGGLLEYGVGIFNGEGINLSVNPDDRFMTVGRIVATPLGAYPPRESAHEHRSKPLVALGIAGMTNSVGLDDDRLAITRINSEAAFRVHGFNVTAEVYHEWARTVDSDRLSTDGWYVQPGFLFPGNRHEFAARYASVGGTSSAGGLIETGVAYSYYLRAHNAKVQADVRNIRDEASGDDRREVRLQLQLSL